MIRNNLTMTLVGALTVVCGLTEHGLTQAPAKQSPRQAPIFQVDSTWPKIPDNWILGPVSSVAVGPDDHVWIVHRPRNLPEAKRAQAAPPVLEFDSAGKFVRAWGGEGKGYDWPSTEHGISIDYKGHVWITGSNPSGGSADAPTDNMVLRFTKAGQFLLQIGGRNQPGGNQNTKNFDRATDVAVYEKTNEAFISDGYGNRRVIVCDADTGAFKRMWGAFGNPPDTDAPSARTVGAPPRPEPPSAEAQPEGSRNFSTPVHAIKVSKDGLVYVADRSNGRIQVFSVDGKYVSQVFINRPKGATAAGLAFSPDAGQTYLYVADSASPGVVVVNRKTLEVIYQFGKRGSAPGDFQGLHHLAADSKGNVYTAEAGGGRAQKFQFKGISSPPS